jgi:hypothetical protein
MPVINDSQVLGFRAQLQQAGDDPVKLAKLMKEIHGALESALAPGTAVSINPELATLNGLSGYVTSRLAEALADAASAGPARRFVGVEVPTSVDRDAHVGDDVVFQIKSQNGVTYLQTSPATVLESAFEVLESVSARDNALGGKDLFFANGASISGAQWKSMRLDDVLPKGDERRAVLQRSGVDLNQARDVMVIAGQGDREPTLAFAGAGLTANNGVTVVCTKVQFIPFDDGSGGGRMVLEKPVVYLYPTQVQDVTVAVHVDGTFLAQYPRMQDGVWRVKAGPTGEIFEPATERRFPYLFWEATRDAPMAIDAARAHCVPGSDAVSFLEDVAARYALNDRERTDFVTYWLPSLAGNPYNVVQLLDDAEYDRYATLAVTPTPDTVIRLFMVFRASATKVDVGAPALPQRTRAGFTVVEWGGADLG